MKSLYNGNLTPPGHRTPTHGDSARAQHGLVGAGKGRGWTADLKLSLLSIN